MSFEKEWAQHKADAGTRLNSASGGSGGGGTAGLVVHVDDLGAVGHEAYVLHEGLRKAGDVTRGAKGGNGNTANAVAELKRENFATAGAISAAVEVWNSQLKTVLQACAHISNHLDYSKAEHARDDAKIAADLSAAKHPVTVSEIEKYFK
ncbi:hypothetical protein [Streptomyces albireticuli]|uniref:AG1 protein n=1 Tax=Streptomyces albireticuli TaxID=1940 RepID=A0A2A2D833_9ACTN|nr:hypothetical protein [Streptomyces albireticuli]MCD9144345.1 hypothetical protein [Streptomyces albireticuli]MCD9162012.1 hypothetical protein [Streptomyces albireticuli]MCD9193982.1 hypothetical protein [Streptomyces albireticuli]PAU47529.1 hypothetical protein CK936_18225 [Streptomyces albireticuli]